MYYVYVIYSNQQDEFYYGKTTDLKRRLKEHNQKRRNTATQQAADWQLVYYEAYLSKRDASERERRLKDYGATRGHLKDRITHSIDKV
ncbi:MAG: GIY-YIG nuclease family protein [Bacteroidetes bacterium]|jgi:putative endonuclease|nr:GIY-YIG nuclease family protein [Bacteroidota bacterium]